MGRRGPPPKPSAQKKLAGTFRKDRAAKREMAPPPGTPPRPDWLDAEGRKEWDRVVPQLEALGVLSEIDGAMLADYCAAHALAVKATRAYQKQGLTVTINGQRLKNPNIKIAQEARAQARLLAGEFGLSPSSRSRVSTAAAEEALKNANERIKGIKKTDPNAPAAPSADPTESFLFGPPPHGSA